MDWIILGVYLTVLFFIFLYSLGQLHLLWHYRKKKVDEDSFKNKEVKDWPMVTIQLPLYNERYVAERLIKQVAALDYPKDKLQIQVLDDSTDDTVTQVAQWVAYFQQEGVDIQQVRREERVGFKAGALDYGLQYAKGEFIAIFDADFMPERDFLKRMLPAFEEGVGVVQARWGHINRDYSFFTRMQAFGLDAHFTVEQGGRNAAGSFINFNGTAGVWRKACIEDAGGWQADTLTEDLDLSYRAQMKGWRFVFREEVEAPAELPVTMEAIKSQQFRWNKGAAECSRKHLANVMGLSVPWTTKIHALFHLMNSSLFLLIFLASVLSVPLLWVKEYNEQAAQLFYIGNIYLIGFLSIALFYWKASQRMQTFDTELSKSYFWKNFPLFLMVSMGLSLHNSLAVLEGWLGFKSPFIRTPKFGVEKKTDAFAGNIYLKHSISLQTLIEGVLCCYFLFGIGLGISYQDYGLLIFHAMLSLGFGSIFWQSMKS
ncbi:cellulose synthase family protein [Algivirga pacifica]|uniref:Glycosyltransferase n=1 Tax=Algivirga pacifica TaxID=1162670 RepID=A0ABP9D7P0_9BACT